MDSLDSTDSLEEMGTARRGNTRRATYGGEQRAITTGGTERRSIDQSRIAQQGRAAAGLDDATAIPNPFSGQPAVPSIQEEGERSPLYHTPFGPTRSSAGTPQGYHTATEAAVRSLGSAEGPQGFNFGEAGSDDDRGTPMSIPNPLFGEREESQNLEEVQASWHDAMPGRGGGRSLQPMAADSPVTPVGGGRQHFRDYHVGPGSHSLRKNELFDIHEDSRRPSGEEPAVGGEGAGASSGKIIPTLTEQFKLSSSLGRVNRDAGALVRQQQQYEEEQAQQLEASRAECRAANEQLARVRVSMKAL